MSAEPDEVTKQILALPGIKRRDIRNCVKCGKGVAHDNNMTFYRFRIERFILNVRGIQQTHGLEQFFGGGGTGAVLADAMGTDPDLAKACALPQTFLICEDCAVHPGPLMELGDN